MYDERQKKSRPWTISYAKTTTRILARSALEAGAKFIETYPGHMMIAIKEGMYT